MPVAHNNSNNAHVCSGCSCVQPLMLNICMYNILPYCITKVKEVTMSIAQQCSRSHFTTRLTSPDWDVDQSDGRVKLSYNATNQFSRLQISSPGWAVLIKCALTRLLDKEVFWFRSIMSIDGPA